MSFLQAWSFNVAIQHQILYENEADTVYSQSISPWIKTNLIKITQWNELEGSFVSVQDIALKGKL